MNVVEYSDAAQLWQVAEPLLCKDVANNTHTLSALRRLARDGAQHGERFFALHDAAGALQATLVRTDIGHAFLSHLSADNAFVIGAALAARDPAELALAGVVGVRDSVEAFARAYAKPTTVYANMMLYVHEGAIVAGDAQRDGGHARVATSADHASVVGMMDAFDEELEMIRLATPTAERVTRRINAQEIVVWQSGEDVVGFAGANPLPAHSARVGPVYVLPAHRRCGIAQAVTAAATAHIQRDGPRTVFLFTDASNPASNKAYQKIGYRHIADHLHLLF